MHNFIHVYDPEDLPEEDDETSQAGHGADMDLGQL
jgi:hypothetical protein